MTLATSSGMKPPIAGPKLPPKGYLNTDLSAVPGISVVPSHSSHGIAVVTGGNNESATNPHHELVVATPMSTMSGKHPEVALKGKMLEVTKKSTGPVFKIVCATCDGNE